MKSFLDPIENAKTIAFLIIIAGLFGMITYLFGLLKTIGSNQSLPIIFGLISSSSYIVLGFGLRKMRIWGLYGFLFLTGITILYLSYYIGKTGSLMGSVLLINIINIALSIWLLSSRHRFIKQ